MKLEDNIRESLQTRELRPSKDSWERLAGRLDDAQKSERKIKPWWIGAVAAAVLTLFTLTFLLKTEEKGDIPILAKTKVEVEEVKNPIRQVEKSKEQKRQVIPEQVQAPTFVKTEMVPNKQDLKKDITSALEEDINILAQVEDDKVEDAIEPPMNQTELENYKISEIVAQIQNMKKDGVTVTDATVEALLQKAQMEIANEAVLNQSFASVNAQSLLQDVESDLQKSFRNKVFDALKNSYEIVKTAVAERQN